MCLPGARFYSHLSAVERIDVHCTLAVTDAVALIVNVQLFVLLPPLEQAPDQIASRPFDTLSVMAVPDANDAEPVLPVATLMPAGLEGPLSTPEQIRWDSAW